VNNLVAYHKFCSTSGWVYFALHFSSSFFQRKKYVHLESEYVHCCTKIGLVWTYSNCSLWFCMLTHLLKASGFQIGPYIIFGVWCLSKRFLLSKGLKLPTSKFGFWTRALASNQEENVTLIYFFLVKFNCLQVSFLIWHLLQAMLITTKTGSNLSMKSVLPHFWKCVSMSGSWAVIIFVRDIKTMMHLKCLSLLKFPFLDR